MTLPLQLGNRGGEEGTERWDMFARVKNFIIPNSVISTVTGTYQATAIIVPVVCPRRNKVKVLKHGT